MRICFEKWQGFNNNKPLRDLFHCSKTRINWNRDDYSVLPRGDSVFFCVFLPQFCFKGTIWLWFAKMLVIINVRKSHCWYVSEFRKGEICPWQMICARNTFRLLQSSLSHKEICFYWFKNSHALFRYSEIFSSVLSWIS